VERCAESSPPTGKGKKTRLDNLRVRADSPRRLVGEEEVRALGSGYRRRPRVRRSILLSRQ
jgi:hypothetical protein